MDEGQTEEIRNPKMEWSSGREHMTEAQLLELERLSALAGEPAPDDHLSKVEASDKIKELRHEIGADDEEDETDTVLDDEE